MNKRSDNNIMGSAINKSYNLKKVKSNRLIRVIHNCFRKENLGSSFVILCFVGILLCAYFHCMIIKIFQRKEEKSYPARIVSISPDIMIVANDISLKRRKNAGLMNEIADVDDIINHVDDQINNEDKIPLVDSASCVPMEEWQEMARPSCNIIHEIDMSNELEKKLGTGGWRIAWKVLKHKVVLKTGKLKLSSLGPVAMSRHFTDAVISERLSSSSYIIDIYAHCAQSVVNEIGKSNLRKDIRDHNHKNSRSSRLIAQYALDLSHALADIHSVDSEGRQNPTIVYKDLKPDNVLVTEGSILKLSDFNDSELLRWNVTSNAPCFFRRKRYKANYRSPEEVLFRLLTYKIDVYAFGGLLFYLLTGSMPYNKIHDNKVALSVAKGILPQLPTNIINNKDPMITKLKDIMLECHRYDPNLRPNIVSIQTELSTLLKS